MSFCILTTVDIRLLTQQHTCVLCFKMKDFTFPLGTHKAATRTQLKECIYCCEIGKALLHIEIKLKQAVSLHLLIKNGS